MLAASMAYYKEAVSRAERPYVESEAPSYNSTVDQFFREYHQLIRLPGAKRRKNVERRRRPQLSRFARFWKHVEGKGPLYRERISAHTKPPSVTGMIRAPYPPFSSPKQLVSDGRQISFIRRAQSGKSG
jgi:hypothetical protein